jgi:hypothetical protein
MLAKGNETSVIAGKRDEVLMEIEFINLGLSSGVGLARPAISR